jgi:hypothetical protein
VSKVYDNVRVFADAETAVYLAPKGTVLPADLAAPAAPWEEVGWISEDGITEGLSVEVTKIKAFQGGKTVRSRPKGTEKTLKFTALETKLQTLQAYYGGTITKTVTGVAPAQVATYTEPGSAGVTEFAAIVDKFDGTVHTRKLYSLVQLGERGDIQSNGDSGDFYEYTFDVVGTVTVVSNDPAITGV